MADFAAVWQDADKIVYSTTLDGPDTGWTVVGANVGGLGLP